MWCSCGAHLSFSSATSQRLLKTRFIHFKELALLFYSINVLSARNFQPRSLSLIHSPELQDIFVCERANSSFGAISCVLSCSETDKKLMLPRFGIRTLRASISLGRIFLLWPRGRDLNWSKFKRSQSKMSCSMAPKGDHSARLILSNPTFRTCFIMQENIVFWGKLAMERYLF